MFVLNNLSLRYHNKSYDYENYDNHWQKKMQQKFEKKVPKPFKSYFFSLEVFSMIQRTLLYLINGNCQNDDKEIRCQKENNLQNNAKFFLKLWKLVLSKTWNQLLADKTTY